MATPCCTGRGRPQQMQKCAILHSYCASRLRGGSLPAATRRPQMHTKILTDTAHTAGNNKFKKVIKLDGSPEMLTSLAHLVVTPQLSMHRKCSICRTLMAHA